MYDYIIIGAGSAGCVLAGRLTRDPNCRVLLLEAGPQDRKKEIHIPAAFSSLFRSDVDWNYSTESELHCGKRRMYWPRGRVLGGCSSMSAMLYIRGHRTDYDNWAAAGNPGWSHDDVLPYFLRSEKQQLGESAFHGVTGPAHVSNQRSVNPMSAAFVEAGLELGFPKNDDFNGPVQDGFGLYQVNQKGGRRWSAAAAFLSSRSNLVIETDAHVNRLRLKGSRVDMVEYVRGGQICQASAAREVLLSAGAVGSPQILELSGIGSEAVLRRAGVKVLHPLPGVGENLQDHMAVGLVYRCKQSNSLSSAKGLGNLAKWLLTGRGPLSSPIAEAGAFLKTSSELTAPDLQFHFAPLAYASHGAWEFAGHAFTIGPTLIRPKSRGSIHIRSSRPETAPAIQPNYLSHPEDVNVFRHGFDLARRLAGTKAMAVHNDGEVLPGNDDFQGFLARFAETLYHPVGTCRMGHDETAVVDESLRVRGLEGLRVVDASIMPVIVGGNTHAPTMMIAERAVDLLRSAK